MTEREQKLQRALEWLINLHEDAFNKRGDYCQEFCPVRDHDRNCPALMPVEEFFCYHERDYQKCMKLQVDYYMENAQ